MISSSTSAPDYFTKDYSDCFGKDNATTLAVYGSTQRDFNPSFPQSIIDKALEEDAEKISAQNIYADGVMILITWLDRPLLESAIDTGVIVRPPAVGCFLYRGRGSSGGKND